MTATDSCLVHATVCVYVRLKRLQGYDFYVEEENKRFLRNLTDDTKSAHQLAAWLTACGPEIRQNFFRETDLTERSPSQRSATQIDNAADAVETWLHDHNDIREWSSKDAVHGVTCHSIIAYGKEKMREHIPKLVEAWGAQTSGGVVTIPTFPSRMPITKSEVQDPSGGDSEGDVDGDGADDLE